MKLYGHPHSPFDRKVRVVLAEKGLAYEAVEVVPGSRTPELLALHPLGKIPVLQDGDVVVPDSTVICAYLERKHPEPALFPADPAELARALFLEEYADTALNEVMRALVFERFVKPKVLQQATDATRVEELLGETLPAALDYVESQLPAGRGTVLARFSIADAALGAQLGRLAVADLEVDAARWPRTEAYSRALLERPSFQACTTRVASPVTPGPLRATMKSATTRS